MKLLLAEDEKDMAAALVAVLEHSGYEVDAVHDGKAALDLAQKGAYACMVFDVMMPLMDGVTALKELRAAGDMTPVLLLTAKAEVEDRIEGLDAGADDYLPKPFAMGELLARLRSLTRRAETYAPAELSLGSVKLDVEKQELAARSAVRLASKETRLMQLLMANAGKRVTTSEIYERIWQGAEEGTDIVWVYISYLRQKLKAIHGDLAILGDQGGSYMICEVN
ncbi:response regulator transcription factor [uncultured Selenomonas sp.]|uniref:response regulator transcription factor n=1 Tax=uncultured Selenomonas sp. TaxID=159275 RepID=UPI0028DB55EA|nr:response regulator transcription factor [uncultured Selenomonas sp.]